MKLPEPSNTLTFAEAAVLANKVIHKGCDSITHTEKYLLAHAAMITRSKKLARIPIHSRERVARIQAAAKSLAINLADSPFRSFCMSFERDEIMLPLKVRSRLKFTASLAAVERSVLLIGAKLLLAEEYREQFLGDIHQLKRELEETLPPSQVRHLIRRQALLSFWPALKWRTRLAIKAFCRVVGILQAVEWITNKF